MTKDNADFDTWFDSVCATVQGLSGVTFRDRDSVRDDYNEGRDATEVASEIADEYNT